MNLNTQQIVLLCLLVSFVTSIATGITVVSLMQQTPEPVTQTINRVIERTVETVTQQPVEDIKNIISQKPSTSPSKEVVTVVVNQEDQSINAVSKNENSVARIFQNSRGEEYVTMGVVINQSGDVVVDKRMLDKRSSYIAYYGNRKFIVKAALDSEKVDFITLKIQGENPNDFSPASIGDSDTLKLAQSVISLSGTKQTSVAIGEIESLRKNTEDKLSIIDTSVNPQNVLTGSILLNLQGNIIGIRISTIEDRTVFLPVNLFKNQVFSQS